MPVAQCLFDEQGEARGTAVSLRRGSFREGKSQQGSDSIADDSEEGGQGIVVFDK